MGKLHLINLSPPPPRTKCVLCPLKPCRRTATLFLLCSLPLTSFPISQRSSPLGQEEAEGTGLYSKYGASASGLHDTVIGELMQHLCSCLQDDPWRGHERAPLLRGQDWLLEDSSCRRGGGGGGGCFPQPHCPTDPSPPCPPTTHHAFLPLVSSLAGGTWGTFLKC